jgi:crotonobetainyl-CoA:carnitine CoA-transferase CaiB-like acyl-CoA transferase
VHNRTLVEWTHPLAGRVRQRRPAARLSVTPAAAGEACPQKGERSHADLREL